MAPRPYNVLGLCAGVGGLELGVRIARPGARGVCYLEREVPAAARLVARMQDGSLHPAPVWSDLTTFDGRPWRGIVDCLTSGDPCQPNSVAGKQRGKDDDRWLLDHVFRIIDEVRPHRVFRENVPGNAHGQLEAIVPALEGMGYRVAAGVFSARGAGASHLRERLFIMADRDGARCETAGTGFALDAGRKPLPGSGDVADAPSARRGPGRSETGGSLWDEARRSQPYGRRQRVGDALGRGDSRQSPEPRRGEVVGTAADGSGDRGVAMADSGRPGSQGLGHGDHQAGRQEPDGHAGLESRARLLFAPGPADARWAQIIGSEPRLAPAVSDLEVFKDLVLQAHEEAAQEGRFDFQTQAQSVVRRLDAWLAQRVDRLRAGGNGVSSLAAALAWRTLEASLEHDRQRSAQSLLIERSAA